MPHPAVHDGGLTVAVALPSLPCRTGRAAREAAAGLGVLPERLAAGQRAELEVLVAALRVELRRAAESLANNETTALARLDARLAVGDHKAAKLGTRRA